MPLLSGITAVIKRALGIPRLASIGVRRSTARLLTFGLKGLGFDVSTIQRQVVEIFDTPTPREVSRVIEAASERMDLVERIGGLADDVRFPRGVMFETGFRKDRNYRYFMHVNILDKTQDMTRSKFVSFYADENLTKDELANWYEQNMLIEYHKAQYELMSYNVFEVWHNKGNSY
jgi:hypothetical protein